MHGDSYTYEQLTDAAFVRRVFFPFGPTVDDATMGTARENMQRALRELDEGEVDPEGQSLYVEPPGPRPIVSTAGISYPDPRLPGESWAQADERINRPCDDHGPDPAADAEEAATEAARSGGGHDWERTSLNGDGGTGDLYEWACKACDYREWSALPDGPQEVEEGCPAGPSGDEHGSRP